MGARKVKAKPGGPRCRAKAKSTGEQCELEPVEGRPTCELHGGTGGAPIKHGRYSKVMGRFRDDYEAARKDTSLMDLSETLALLDINVQKAAARCADLDTPRFRQQALDIFVRLEAAHASVDDPGLSSAVVSLGKLLRAGVREDRALDHLTNCAERLAKRTEAAWGVKLHAQQSVNTRDLAVIFARILDTVLDVSSKAGQNTLGTRIVNELERELVLK